MPPRLAAPGDRLPHGESIEEALRRCADALRHLLDRTETVTLVVIHDLALRHIAAAAAIGLRPTRAASAADVTGYR